MEMHFKLRCTSLPSDKEVIGAFPGMEMTKGKTTKKEKIQNEKKRERVVICN